MPPPPAPPPGDGHRDRSPTAARSVLHAATPLGDLDAYRAVGGGRGIAAALALAPDDVIATVTEAGLRGRGGAGFPTGVKWRSVRDASDGPAYVVANAAEGEPATYKDRWLLRTNPYQVVEGLTIAAHAVGAGAAFVALEGSCAAARSALDRALREMTAAGMLGAVRVEVVAGPDAYLFGEETACLEVIEGRPPLPRLLKPHQVGLFADRGARHPTVVNNAETLAHVPPILRDGPAAFRTRGTAESPGTMLFTVCGDVARHAVVELELGTPLRDLVHGTGGGPRPGATVKAVVPGASAGVLTGADVDVPLSFKALRAAGSGLGSGGFAVYDDDACIVSVTASFTRFLAEESCGQCPACPTGAGRITEALDRIESGAGGPEDVDRIRAKLATVINGSRCGLPVGTRHLVRSVLERFGDEVIAHLGQPCPRPGPRSFPRLVDLNGDGGRFLVRDPVPRPGRVGTVGARA
ncbi:NADH-quinone oxidoreductase subunit NuoF [soil metagenome]